VNTNARESRINEPHLVLFECSRRHGASSSLMSVSIHIRRMRLRVPGVSREAGEAIAASLHERLASLSLEGAPQHVGRMCLRLPGGDRMNAGAVADSVASAVSAKLTRNHGSAHA
jgi:hypothetical protein